MVHAKIRHRHIRRQWEPPSDANWSTESKTRIQKLLRSELIAILSVSRGLHSRMLRSRIRTDRATNRKKPVVPRKLLDSGAEIQIRYPSHSARNKSAPRQGTKMHSGSTRKAPFECSRPLGRFYRRSRRSKSQLHLLAVSFGLHLITHFHI